MSILKFKGHSKASGANVAYITRDSACDSISFHNLDELEAGDRYDNKVNALSYAHNREEEETKRTHYRVTLSWEDKEDTEKAKEMTHHFLKENFNDSRAIVAIHQDTDQTHAHVWIDARQTDDKKIHSSKNHLNELCTSWQSQYDREYNTNYEKEFSAKREETRQYKEAMHNGENAEKPTRAKITAEKWREKDERDAGVKINGFDKEGLGRNQRFTSDTERISKESEQRISGATEQINRTESEARGLHQEIEKLAGKSKELDNKGDLER